MRTLITNATLLDTDPEPRVVEGDLLIETARELGPHISLHRHGLLGPDVMVVHGNGFTDRALSMMADAGATATVTPAVEAQMGHGAAETTRFRARGIATGLGVDTAETTSAYARERAEEVRARLAA